MKLRGAVARSAVALVIAVALVASAQAGTETKRGRNGLLLFSDVDSGGREWLATLDLRTKRPKVRRFNITPGGTPWSPEDGAAWSPDGLRLAVGGAGIWIGRADGTRLARVAGSGDQPSWSPDGSRIVFAGDGGIEVVRSDGRGRRLLLGMGENPSWSPDGASIAFEVRGPRPRDAAHVYVMNADGTNVRQLTRDEPPDAQRCSVSYHNPTWQLDPAALLYDATGGCAQSSIREYSAIYRAAAVDERGKLFLASGDSYDGGYWSPAASPDGRLIAVAHETTSCCRIELVSSADGSLRRRIRRNGSPLDWQPVCTRQGTERRDRVSGTSGADLLCGLSGADVVTGGSGMDRLFGESGDDVLRAADGEFDVVGCGLGRDRVFADRRDLVGIDCERITRT